MFLLLFYLLNYNYNPSTLSFVLLLISKKSINQKPLCTAHPNKTTRKANRHLLHSFQMSNDHTLSNETLIHPILPPLFLSLLSLLLTIIVNATSFHLYHYIIVFVTLISTTIAIRPSPIVVTPMPKTHRVLQVSKYIYSWVMILTNQ